MKHSALPAPVIVLLEPSPVPDQGVVREYQQIFESFVALSGRVGRRYGGTGPPGPGGYRAIEGEVVVVRKVLYLDERGQLSRRPGPILGTVMRGRAVRMRFSVRESEAGRE